MYKQAIKERVVEAAVQLMSKAGCAVTQTRNGDFLTLDVHIPPDPADIHGARLSEALA